MRLIERLSFAKSNRSLRSFTCKCIWPALSSRLLARGPLTRERPLPFLPINGAKLSLVIGQVFGVMDNSCVAAVLSELSRRERLAILAAGLDMPLSLIRLRTRSPEKNQLQCTAILTFRKSRTPRHAV
jgi:hypothetical protein